MEIRLVVLEGAYNVRDLGGYTTVSGKETKWGRFYRGDGLQGLTNKDVEILKKKNITLDIDLRSHSEITKHVDRLKGIKGIAYESISLLSIFEEQIKDLGQGDFSKLPKSLGEFYVMVLNYCQEKFKEVFKLIAHTEKGAIIFHCSVGKDRTGMIAALLLNLVGVSDNLIIEDYAYSEKNIGPVIKTYENMNEEHLKPFLVAGPESMAMFLEELKKAYGNSVGFLRHLGLSNQEIQNIVDTFV